MKNIYIFLVLTLCGIVYSFGPFIHAQSFEEKTFETSLDQNGRLKESLKGSFNSENYKMDYGENNEPLFKKLSSLNKTNGITWSVLGTGLNGIVTAIAISGSDIYVGGNFTQAGGVSANYIAKWNGNSWSALGVGVNGIVYALALSGTDLYVGGSFTLAGGSSANRIAKWDGSNWSALGSPINGTGGTVYAIAISAPNVYAGGYFSTAGGSSANNIAMWNEVHGTHSAVQPMV